jgi:hypothetical protein
MIDIGLHLESVHDRQGLNDFNPGIYAIAENGATLGVYKNSVNKTSMYVGQTFKPYGTLRITAGVISGYHNEVKPFAIPSVDVGRGFRLAFVPKVGSVKSNAVHLMYEF